MHRRLVRQLGEARFHWAYFDPTEPPGSNEKAVVHDLADDLADIWRDLEQGLKAWDKDPVRYSSAITLGWQSPSMESHWGVHAVSALRALHPLVFLRGLKNPVRRKRATSGRARRADRRRTS